MNAHIKAFDYDMRTTSAVNCYAADFSLVFRTVPISSEDQVTYRNPKKNFSFDEIKEFVLKY